jgi:hypothetical protein
MADSKDRGFFRVTIDIHGFYKSYFDYMSKSLSKDDGVKIPDGRVRRLTWCKKRSRLSSLFKRKTAIIGGFSFMLDSTERMLS